MQATAPIPRPTSIGCTSSAAPATWASRCPEIGDLLSLWNDQSRQSADVKRVALAHIAELDRRIESMQKLAETLKALIRCRAGDERPNYPILASEGAVLDVPAAAST